MKNYFGNLKLHLLKTLLDSNPDKREDLIMAKECLVCGKSIGALTGKVAIADGHICTECWKEAGMDNSVASLMSGRQYTSDVIRKIFENRKKNQHLIESFQPTKKIGAISFDDNTQSFIIEKSKKSKDLYFFNQIVNFELLENGETITRGGLGSAVAGGLLFGDVGAVVGSAIGGKKTKPVCKSMQVKITLRDCPKQTEYINLISSDTKTSSFVYKTAYRSAQDTLSALQLAVEKANKNASSDTPVQQATSSADEILKYKNLLDAGIITQEEFDAKKKQLLGL